MSTRHWNDEELIARLYGLGRLDGHLDDCAECAARWQALQAARERVLAPPSLSDESLAGQRRAVYQRLENGGQGRRWVAQAALATAAMVLLAIVLVQPAPVPDPGPSDAELYAEAFSLVQSDEPRVVEAMHGLFETEGNQ